MNYHPLTVPLPYRFVTSQRRPWISGREVVGMSYNSMQDIPFQNSMVFTTEWNLCWGMYCSKLGAGIWISGLILFSLQANTCCSKQWAVAGRHYWYSPFICTNECLPLSIVLWPLCYEKYSTCWPLEYLLPKKRALALASNEVNCNPHRMLFLFTLNIL